MTIRHERHYDPDLLGSTMYAMSNTIVPISVQNSVAGVGNGADATEDVLMTFNVPANTFAAKSANGVQGLLIEAWGTTATNNNNKTIKGYFGSTSFTHMSAVGAGSSNVTWWLELWVMRTSTSTFSVFGSGQYGSTLSTIAGTTGNSATETAAITVKVTGQSGSSGQNDIVCNNMTIWTIEQ